ncbi:unnamed protein product [Parnassius apollo]|uniref:(apollo) hypothetical protein n=1 Tax=Parnassius apollo TaxID=110799 RepID=A0A8S3WW84_PARAO|nr:unnamed protein product [Parnassius apollo]
MATVSYNHATNFGEKIYKCFVNFLHQDQFNLKMTKNKNENKTKSKTKRVQTENNANIKEIKKIAAQPDSLVEEDQSFGCWLRSPDGLENMKFFVIANSIVLLTTLMYPHIQLIVDTVYEYFYKTDSVY